MISPFWFASTNISSRVCTESIPIRVRSMKANHCLENVAIEHVMPFALFVSLNFTLMQDNACPHMTGEIINYLNAGNIPLRLLGLCERTR